MSIAAEAVAACDRRHTGNGDGREQPDLGIDTGNDLKADDLRCRHQRYDSRKQRPVGPVLGGKVALLWCLTDRRLEDSPGISPGPCGYSARSRQKGARQYRWRHSLP